MANPAWFALKKAGGSSVSDSTPLLKKFAPSPSAVLFSAPLVRDDVHTKFGLQLDYADAPGLAKFVIVAVNPYSPAWYFNQRCNILGTGYNFRVGDHIIGVNAEVAADKMLQSFQHDTWVVMCIERDIKAPPGAWRGPPGGPPEAWRL